MTKIEKWAHIAEIAGAAAVVVSLIYVGYEIRQNTTAVRNGTQQALLTLGQDWGAWLANPAFADVLAKGNADYSGLSQSQKLQYDQYVEGVLNIWEYAFYSAQDGMMKDELWRAWDANFRTSVMEDSWRSVWRAAGESYGSQFRAHVSAYLADR